MNEKVPALRWLDLLRVYTKPRVVVMLFLGFSAGLPFLLVFSTLSAWLTEEGLSRTAIGFFSWVGITYSIKVVWAPFIDRLRLPLLTRWLGRRRGWMLLAQVGIGLGLLGVALLGPAQLLPFALLAVFIAFCSATQDVVIDAYRIEIAKKEYQAALAAMYIFGYRVALLVAGAGALYAAELRGWTYSYLLMAVCMLIGVATTLVISEPPANRASVTRPSPTSAARTGNASHWFVTAVARPFSDFFQRNRQLAWLILLLIGIYRISDIVMGVMANPFYLDMGYTKTQIADVSKLFGFFMTIAGAGLGGLLVLRHGVMPILVLGAGLVCLTNLLFAALSQAQPDIVLLAAVISADNISGGIATSVFIAYLSGLTSRAYTATQYALFSSLMTLPAKLIGGVSGIVVDSHGYFSFFVYAAAIGLPAIVVAILLMRIDKGASRTA